MQVCKICLAVDTKLYQDHNLNNCYAQLTGININEEECLPRWWCWECAHRLKKSSDLRSKAVRSYNLLIDVLQSSHFLTLDTLTSIDRTANHLTSTLTHKSFETNHSDLHLHDTSHSDDTEKYTSDQLVIEFKLENDSETDTRDFSNEINDNGHLNEDSTSSSDNVVLSKHKTKVRDKKTKKNKRKIDIAEKSKKEPKIDRRRKPANEVLSEEIFEITDLSFEEKLSEIRKRRESSNYRNAEYKCAECYKGFLDQDAYKSHTIRHTEQSGTYVCEICRIRFKKQHALRNHEMSHLQKFSCKRCTYVTTRRHAAKLHEEYHNGTRYQCPHCTEDFCKFSTYMSHVRIKHPSDFVCQLCGHSFVSDKGLLLHKKLKHRFNEETVPADGPLCAACAIRFVSTEALDTHVTLSANHRQDVATKTKRMVRKERDAEHHSVENEAQKRSKVNKVEGPIPCEQCDMQLPNSLLYYRHFRRTHPDKNRTNYPSMKTKCMCEVCGKMFQSLALLQDHSFTHLDSKQFKCTQCDKSFQRKYRLIAHKRLHTSQRRSHACNVCGKRFTTSGNMQRHMVSHTGLKPFKCEMCGKCFKHASEKRVHITYVHLKKPWPKRSRGKRRSDGRQDPMPPQMPADTSLVPPPWPACNDPKLNEIHDKPLYYNLKI